MPSRAESESSSVTAPPEASTTPGEHTLPDSESSQAGGGEHTSPPSESTSPSPDTLNSHEDIALERKRLELDRREWELEQQQAEVNRQAQRVEEPEIDTISLQDQQAADEQQEQQPEMVTEHYRSGVRWRTRQVPKT